jgi:hypothetical protein
MNLFAPLAFWGFWILLAVGWMLGELRVTGVAIFVLLWLAGFFGLRLLVFEALFGPYVTILDIALVLIVFKGDVRLSGR